MLFEIYRKLINRLKNIYIFESTIHFVYADKYRDFGSTVLRGKQLSLIAKRALYPTKAYYTSTDYKYKNCTLFLTKWAIFTYSIKDLYELKLNGNKLIFDPVDSNVPPERSRYADIVVAPSETIYKKYKNKFPPPIKIVIVNHNVDSRLRKLNFSKRSKMFKVGYFGEAINTVLTPKIKKLIDPFWVSTISQNNDWFKELPKYNLHYAVRKPREFYLNKPFMKGFVAAHCNANILIQDSEKEAVKWLGEDYPYLLHGKVTEKKILDILKYAKKTFGTKTWTKGLEIMQKIKEKTSDEVIGKELVNLFVEIDKLKK